ncbi:uncharacterized protein [Mytilus edulis]|uniref:uncharacterized protein n=1 Tax=Mytilus edulis TaxID=6550 RepID=UPI0039F11CF7
MITVLTVIGLSEWPDIIFRCSTDNNTTEQLLVEQHVSGNSLNETESDSKEIDPIQKEMNRTLMGKLLSGDENDYNEFITFLKSYSEYNNLVCRIENTEVTKTDILAFHNCQRNTEQSG